MSIKLNSKRISKISEPVSQNLLSRVKFLKNKGVKIHDFSKQKNVPNEAIENAIKSLKSSDGNLSTDVRGSLELRKSIAQKVYNYNALDIDPEKNIVVTVGAKEAILSTFLAILDYGDEVIVEDPGYLSFEPLINLVGAKPIHLQLNKKNNFKFLINELRKKINSKTKLLLLCNPHNPTGRCFSYNDLAEISKVCVEHDIFVLSDEAYEHFVFDKNKHFSIASFPGMFERTITIQTVSKIYNMSGWRIGWAISHDEIITKILLAHSHVVTSPTSFSQAGVIPVLEKNIGEGGEAINKIVDRYQQQRDIMVSLLQSISGVECHLPEGTFFAFPDISSYGSNSIEISNYLLNHYKVATVPGNAFGPSGEGFLRLVFKSDVKAIHSGILQMKNGLEFFQKKFSKV